MQETVREIHSRGFANLELNEENIIITVDGQNVSLVDLGTTEKYSCFSRSLLFEQRKDEDLRLLEGTFKKFRSAMKPKDFVVGN